MERYSYTPFGPTTVCDAAGNPKTSNVSDFGNRFMFTGREYDDETNLYYYRARMYSPALGRFMQPDPIGYADSMNLYQYCGNNPVNFVDPWGLKSKEGGFLDGVWRGAVYGDFDDNAGWGGVGGQVGVGFIPIAGQIADARDTAAAIRAVYNDPCSIGSWCNLGMTLFAWMPGIGDAAKAGYKAGRQAAKEGAQVAAKNSGEYLYRTMHKLDPQAADFQKVGDVGVVKPRGGHNNLNQHVNDGDTNSIFTSWSTDKDMNWAQWGGDDCVQVRINSKDLTNPAMDVSKWSEFPSELETVIIGPVQNVERIQ